MLAEMIFAGFGGQGVLSMGKNLAYAAIEDGKEVSWMPSYGPEQRGGTANCMVNVSDEPIASPIVQAYDAAVVFNQPSLEKFESKVKKGGVLVWESSTIKKHPTRTDITVVAIPAIEIATNELKNTQVMNMIALGALLKHLPVVQIETVIKALEHTLPERHHKLIPLNEQAMRIGCERA